MKRGILRIFAVVLASAVSLIGGQKAADASVDKKVDRAKSELQQRIDAAQKNLDKTTSPKDQKKMVQWYNWNNWENWDNWDNWNNW